ncbi:hypothetical protein HHK36_023340 [Tetracentron sinense]|uniref:K Homology domain-containing protein n=1 Tax=Tetracentron sinense TaxID=13715 RepID=A0A834YN07_TETSI|nr:hypothetical protein HHK36_023340 [Tetracentron sinense]
MGETGKRSRSQRRDHDVDEKYQKRRPSNKDDARDRDDELVVYRILCPDAVIGSVIGKGGKVINSIRQETRAKIKVVDPFPGAKERVITMYCYVKDKDEVDVDDDDYDSEPLCPAQDALLKVHAAIANTVATIGDSDKKHKDKEEVQMLVPTSQAANVIGKSGATIKKLRNKTRANIKVTPKDANDPTHSCAMDFDNFVMFRDSKLVLSLEHLLGWSLAAAQAEVAARVEPRGRPSGHRSSGSGVPPERFRDKFEVSLKHSAQAEISGDAEAVTKALYAVSAIMYKFSPREEISLEATVPEVPPIIIPSDVPIYPSGGFYSRADHLVPPSRSVTSATGPTPHVSEHQGYMDTGSAWPMYSSALPVVSSYGVPSRSEDLIVRLLCPMDKIGRVIGKGGSSIKSVRQASGARVEVDDTKDNRDECLITVTSTESADDQKSMAVEAILLLQGKINDNDDDDTVSIRLLVPSKIIGCIIGKSGSIINEIRKRTKADVRISKGEKPKCAGDNDELVEIVLRLRDNILKDRDDGRNHPPAAESLYSGGSGFAMPSVLPSVPPVTSYGYDQRVETGSGLGMLSSSSLYGYGSLSVGENGYGSISSYSSKPYGGLPPPSTLEMSIPAKAVGKVMGKGGANIANIRQISGAIIEILDSKSSRGDRVAQISGTPEQKRSAENLIQAFIMAT